MTKRQAQYLRLPHEKTVPYWGHVNPDDNLTCSYSDGTILPPHPHTCNGGLEKRWQNVLRSGDDVRSER